MKIERDDPCGCASAAKPSYSLQLLIAAIERAQERKREAEKKEEPCHEVVQCKVTH